jgi:hypothetical protein
VLPGAFRDFRILWWSYTIKNFESIPAQDYRLPAVPPARRQRVFAGFSGFALFWRGVWRPLPLSPGSGPSLCAGEAKLADGEVGSTTRPTAAVAAAVFWTADWKNPGAQRKRRKRGPSAPPTPRQGLPAAEPFWRAKGGQPRPKNPSDPDPPLVANVDLTEPGQAHEPAKTQDPQRGLDFHRFTCSNEEVGSLQSGFHAAGDAELPTRPSSSISNLSSFSYRLAGTQVFAAFGG